MDEITVDAASLRAALTRMARLVGKTAGDAIFEFSADALILQWGGATESLVIDSPVAKTVSISGDFVAGLAKVLPKSGEVSIRLDDARIRFDTLACTCKVLNRRPPRMLPIDASPLDVLMLRYREDAADIAAAGLSEDLDAAQERARESVQRAAKELAWLNITPEILASWIEAQLEAYSRGETSFSMTPKNIIVEESGQFTLFRS
ncbi:MAG: hypothetical protein ACPGU1_21820 [Myxococcota bacterium]